MSKNKAVLKELKLTSNRKVQNLADVITINWYKLISSAIGFIIAMAFVIYIGAKLL